MLVDGDGHARLTDFGIARPRNATAITRAGHVIGTERYLAPEVMAGEPASERSDLFALGVVLAEVVSRRRRREPVLEPDREARDPGPANAPGFGDRGAAMVEREERWHRGGRTTQPFAIERRRPTAAEPAQTAPTRRSFEPRASGPKRPLRPTGGAVATLALCAAAVVLVVVVRPRSAAADEGSGAGSQAERTGSAGSKAGDSKPAADSSTDAGASASSGRRRGLADRPACAPADAAPPTATAPGDRRRIAQRPGLRALNAGRPEEAVPILERAVDALRGSGDEATYNYALYNLGVAYLGAGRPEDAIPVLEERMGYDDGQLDEVQARLDQAYADAGVAPPGSEPGNSTQAEKPPKAGKPPKAEKPPKGPKPGNGPPFGEGGD